MIYLAHIGCWMTFLLFRTIYKGGTLKVVDALIISAVAALFSSLPHYVFF